MDRIESNDGPQQAVGGPAAPVVRVAVADDVMLIRSGVARLLEDAGIDVVAECADADELMRAVALERPDVAIVDIRMPPTHTDEGLVAAQKIRRLHPETAVIVLSQYVEATYARRLMADQSEGCGYLLKERVSDIAVLVDVIRRVRDGECVIDPTIVRQLVRRPKAGSRLSRLSEREAEILSLMAEGLTNSAIAGRLHLSEKTIEANIAALFRTLDVPLSPDINRRVVAVVTLLTS